MSIFLSVRIQSSGLEEDLHPRVFRFTKKDERCANEHRRQGWPGKEEFVAHLAVGSQRIGRNEKCVSFVNSCSTNVDRVEGCDNSSSRITPTE